MIWVWIWCKEGSVYSARQGQRVIGACLRELPPKRSFHHQTSLDQTAKSALGAPSLFVSCYVACGENPRDLFRPSFWW